MNGSNLHIGFVAIGGASWMGGANYIRNLATAVHAANPAVKISYIVGEDLLPDWSDVEPRVVIPTRTSLLRKIFSGGPTLREAVEANAMDFVYPLTYDNEYNLGLKFPLRDELGDRGWAGWIPDFQHRYLPELFSADEIRRRDEGIRLLGREAPRMVFSSANAADDFRAHDPAHADKVELLRFCVPPLDLEGAEDGRDLPERFLLVCNQFWKHKNHLLVFAALKLLRERGVQPLVLCTGKLDDYRDASHSAAIRAALDNGIADQVQLLGLVPRARQVALMRKTLAIIQPSLFEGWSTVVEDVRGLGRPSLLSDIPVHREQAPERASYFNPRSVEALAEVMAEAWLNGTPGPDLAAESVAQHEASERVVAVGRRMLEIAEAGRR